MENRLVCLPLLAFAIGTFVWPELLLDFVRATFGLVFWSLVLVVAFCNRSACLAGHHPGLSPVSEP